jgi:hypothetical protein
MAQVKRARLTKRHDSRRPSEFIYASLFSQNGQAAPMSVAIEPSFARVKVAPERDSTQAVSRNTRSAGAKTKSPAAESPPAIAM